MKQINYKKLILPNIPYVFFVYLFDKVGQAVRLAPGADISAKNLEKEKKPSIRKELDQAKQQAKAQHRQREKVKTKDRGVEL